MNPSLLPQVQSATFEVVAAKPTRDPLSYARKLPLDLLPYQERTDKYYSIGTAFAIGKNRYLTAAHVLMVGLDSLWGPPSLRDSSGKVYRIDKIEKFSQRRDFVTFSLVDPPATKPYPTYTQAQLNQVVYAVGNALGTGVVIRDGLYTSDTPESLSGSWKWMRFSAAASPGNSGGPLLDSEGRVIGLVLMKSANENLNYALPISEVLDAPAHEAVIKQRLGYRFIVFDRTLHNLFEAHFKLPLSLDDFFATYARKQQAYTDSQLKLLLTTEQDNMFPHGEHSEALLQGGTRMINYPSLVVRGDNGDWHLSEPSKSRVKLDDNGYIEIGTFQDIAILFHLRKPDSISAQQLYHEPERLMKLIAATGYLKRSVGNDQVKITSLGKPASDTTHTDKWQRPWQVRTWPIPYRNSIAMVMTLPTPDGCSGIMYVAPSTRRHDYMVNLKALADFAYVTYDGSLAQWRAFLKQRKLLPAAFSDIDIDFDYDQQFSYRSKRLDLSYTPDLQSIRADSMFTLGFSFFHDHDAVVWDVADVWAAPDAYDNNAINIARQSRPTDALGNDYQSVWRKISERKHPFDAVPRLEDDIMKISSVAGPPADANPDVLYTLYFYHDGKQTDAFMKKQLHLLESGLKLR